MSDASLAGVALQGVDAEARLQVALGDAIGPIATASDEERAGLKGRLGQLVADSSVDVTRADRPRAVVSVREDGDQEGRAVDRPLGCAGHDDLEVAKALAHLLGAGLALGA